MIFSIVEALCNIERCRLRLENFNALIMLQKNWPCDAHDGCTCRGDVVKECLTNEVDLLDAHEWNLWEVGYCEDDVE